jgi:STE24 endopeptidase
VREEVLMGRCVRFHRFLVSLWLGLLLICAAPAATLKATRNAESPAERALALSAFSSHSAKTQSNSKNEEYHLSRERYEKAIDFSRASYQLYFASVFLTLAALWIILQSGIAAKYRDWAERISDHRSLQALIFVPLLLLTVDLVNLPLHLYGHMLSLRYEVSVQGWGSWFLDWGKERLLMAGFALLLALGLSAMIRKSPSRWWLYSWFAAVPAAAFLVFISPWFIDPMFNKFEPLQATHPDLVASIEKLTARAGVPIPPDRMFLMKASDKTNAIDAYVTGLGASKRVVIWDTTIRKATPDETLYIVGHELGHYVLGHVWKGFLFFAVLLLVGFYALFRALHWALGKWSGEWRIYGPEDWAALAVLFLLVEAGLFLSSPIANGFSRMEEHAADVYGLEVTHGIIPDSSEVGARAFQVLGETDLADPDPSPFITLWLYSHPPLNDRLTFAAEYHPWDEGKPSMYVK